MKIKLNKNEIRMKYIKMEVKLTTKSQWWLKRKAKYRERTFLKNCSISTFSCNVSLEQEFYRV